MHSRRRKNKWWNSNFLGLLTPNIRILQKNRNLKVYYQINMHKRIIFSIRSLEKMVSLIDSHNRHQFKSLIISIEVKFSKNPKMPSNSSISQILQLLKKKNKNPPYRVYNQSANKNRQYSRKPNKMPNYKHY